MKLLPAIAFTALLLLLAACGNSPVAVATIQQPISVPTSSDEATLVVGVAQAITLDSGNSGMAGYHCRYAVCAGDDRDNNAVRGLLEFTLPESLKNAEIISAALILTPSNPQTAQATQAELGDLLVEAVGDLSFDAPASSLSRASNSVDVTAALKSDLQSRSVSQYRLRLSRDSNDDDVSNLVRFEVQEAGTPQPSENAPRLVIRFRVN